jgi:CheY-like chemotaxis protein
MSPAAKPRIVILLVEDNPADVLFFREALEETAIPAQLQVVDNGAAAMEYLCRQGLYADALCPNVVVLDLNLPRKTGGEVLREMMAAPRLNATPVAILTTSKSEAHLIANYSPGRCLYFAKTENFDHLQDIIRQIAAHAAVSPR